MGKTISTLYTEDTGRFPVRSRIGNQYLMVAYHCDKNSILFSCLEGLDEDGVFIAVVGHHQVLIADAGANREAACVFRVERADGFYP